MMNKLSFKNAGFVLLTILLAFNISEVKSQISNDRVDISFGIQTYDPVHIKVDDKDGSGFSTPIRFTALNSTYYSFQLLIDFIQFDNLSPKPPAREMKLSHGLNNLFTFSIHVPGTGHGYSYTYKYWLTPSHVEINNEFPYLIPLKDGKNVNSKKIYSGRIQDSFTGNPGDTVYCMRRGLVTAVPRSETLDFRLSGHDCLEILHEDGTYMIYNYLKKNEDIIAPGKIVLPGQPIGILSDSSFLIVSLMKIEENKNLMINQPIRYAIERSDTATFDEIDGREKSARPREVIIREMNSRELKKAGKGR